MKLNHFIFSNLVILSSLQLHCSSEPTEDKEEVVHTTPDMTGDTSFILADAPSDLPDTHSFDMAHMPDSSQDMHVTDMHVPRDMANIPEDMNAQDMTSTEDMNLADLIEVEDATPDMPACTPLTPQPGDPLAALDPCTQKLAYAPYANHNQTQETHTLPDFSFAGYQRGGVALPSSYTRHVTLSPDTNDASDHQRIQQAIDMVATLPKDAQGLRGEVYLEAGSYELDEGLTITADGIILSGAGQNPDQGTLLIARKAVQHTVIDVHGPGSGLGLHLDEASTQDITSPHVPVGATSFEVTNAATFQVGDEVVITRTPNQAWIDLLDMATYGWTTTSYAIPHIRHITGIQGNSVTIDVPIVDALQDLYGSGTITKITSADFIQEVGVQNLWIRSDYDQNNPEDEQHAWTAIAFNRARHSWIHGVTGEHMGLSTVHLNQGALYNTAQEVAFLNPVSQVTGGRRYPFYINGSYNLIQRCYAEQGRHNFVTGSRVTGPNVWLDCLAMSSSNDDGPHHRWATGLLFDNIQSTRFHVQNRKDSGSGHGWAGAQVMLWNSVVERIIIDAPPAAMNWSVGTMYQHQDEGSWAPEEDTGMIQSAQQHVTPRSLYIQQLEDRLGTPAVNAITSQAQRQGTLWTTLYAWKGVGELALVTPVPEIPEVCPGIANGQVCCASQCGTCGGSGCGGRPGGAAECCSSPILSSGDYCDETLTAPCIIR